MRRLLFFFSGRNGLESLAEMKWNQWPESNGMGGRDRLEFAEEALFFIEKYNMTKSSIRSYCRIRMQAPSFVLISL